MNVFVSRLHNIPASPVNCVLSRTLVGLASWAVHLVSLSEQDKDIKSSSEQFLNR